jgi:ParB family chromosome partitioning protein
MQLRLESLAMPEPAAANSGQPLLLPVEAIDEDPDQPRLEFDDESLRELAETIARRGVRQPISVRPHPVDPDRWILNFGARRLRASKLACKTDIPAFVDEAADSYDQVIENEQRKALRPLELAMFVQRRLARGETQAEIARLLGKSQPYIVYVSALIDAPHWLMELYRQGRCRGMIELYQLRRLHALAPARVEQWISERPVIARADVQQLKGEFQEADPSPPAALPSLPAPTPMPAHPAPEASFAVRTSPTSEPLRPSPEAQRSSSAGQVAPRKALFAHRGNAVVEVIVNRAPDNRDTVFVRSTRGVELEAVPAASLMLIGFLPVDKA